MPPTPSTKSTEDLKAILRAMTAKGGAEREEKQSQHQQSLKGALSDALQKGKPETVSNAQPEQPAPVPVRETPPASPSAPTAEGKRPFEVPEEALRNVLKGES